MLSNRSIPRATVIPVLAYKDVNQAAAWLCDAFGFTVRLRIANHRVQMNVGDGAVIVRELHANEVDAPLAWDTRSQFASTTPMPTANAPGSTARRLRRSPSVTPTASGNTTPRTSRDTRGLFPNR